MRMCLLVLWSALGFGCRAPADVDASPSPAPPKLGPVVLDGHWQVTEPDGTVAEWVISGGTELTRGYGGQQERGWIEQPAPGRLIVRLPKGRVWFMGVAHDGARPWIGAGRGGQRLPDGGWVVADNGLVVARPSGVCQWFRQKVKGGYHPPLAVDCAVTGLSWRYTLPRRTGAGAEAPRTVRLEGQAVLGEGLRPAVPLP